MKEVFKKLHELTPVFVKFIPPKIEMEHGKIYISEMFETTSHLCACGCGSLTVCEIVPITGWGFTKNESETVVSLTPSIYNKYYPCGSHYFLTDNKINWCN